MAATHNKNAQTGSADPMIQKFAQEDPVPWYKKPNLRYLYLLLFPTCMAMELTSGFDGQMVNALQIVPAWVERWSIFVCSAIMIAGAILQGFSVNGMYSSFQNASSSNVETDSVVLLVGMYIFSRILLGFGFAPASVSAAALLGELGYPKERPFLTTFMAVSLYPGMILAAGICFGTNHIPGNNSWRIPSWLQAVPSLIQLVLCLFIPESPRWLIAHDRHDEAYAILAKYHAEGDTESDFVKAEFAHMRTTIELEMGFSKRSYLDLLRTSGMRRRTLVAIGVGFFKQCSGNTLVSYFLSQILDMIGITNSTTKQTINLSLSCFSLVCAVPIVMYCVDMSRIKTAYISSTGMLLVFVAWTIAMQKSLEATEQGNINNAANMAVMVFIFLYKPAYQIFYNAMVFTYMVEIWPYAERSRGLAVHKVVTVLAAAASTFINPIGLENIGWYFFIVYIVILAGEIVFVYFFFPETHGRTLEELTFLFEDKALAEAANDAAAAAVKGHVDQVEEVSGKDKV
ncbi:hypothetical protein F5X68DRAFT_215386 [Plectosphaerella plurivora]|uniref:Major facilitator superfamily (MFS) profile domain-containing protein n=1 Tax=Plectosphaerella plurivora TaxID=936078 RepID=A0A9P8V3E2_9PEZI|nr:hypothetical protein F5X68DRAFT_215386 [Plectosphaerella plurivora]